MAFYRGNGCDNDESCEIHVEGDNIIEAHGRERQGDKINETLLTISRRLFDSKSASGVLPTV